MLTAWRPLLVKMRQIGVGEAERDYGFTTNETTKIKKGFLDIYFCT